MVIRLKTVLFIVWGLLILWFLYIERAILTPFVLAGIFAYIFNPVVNFFSNKIRIPRTISVIIVYLFIMSLVVVFSALVTKRIISESSELKDYMDTLLLATKTQINNLPDFIKPIAEDTLVSLEKSKIFSPVSVFAIFPQAISRIVSFFIFLFAGFYFLKE